MKASIIFIILLPVLAWAQVKDSFTDGDFTINPRWSGDSTQFKVNQAFQLQLQSEGTDTSSLFTSFHCFPESEWSWWMKLSFNTSVNNYARLYLFADTTNVRLITAGLYVQVGGSDDSISIVKQTGNIHRKLFTVKHYKTDQTTNELRFKILKSETDHWEVYLDSTGGLGFYMCGSFQEQFVPGRWFGVYCRYTSSNSTKAYFDDFYAGPVVYDTIAPVIISKAFVESKNIRLAFSEPTDGTSGRNRFNYLLMNAHLNPDSVVFPGNDPSKVELRFGKEISENSCDTLRVSGVMDLGGNIMKDTTLAGFCHFHPKAWDILINEIFADPEPQVGLPMSEFLELYNTTAFPVSLDGWQLQFGSNRKPLPPVEIEPHGFLILSKDSIYLTYGASALIFTASSSLSNEGTMLVLKDQEQHIIHAVSWDPDWFRNSYKKEGGWSVELMDPENPCGCSENWKPSTDETGGTPGRMNSVISEARDVINPSPINAVVSGSKSIEIRFSESLDSVMFNHSLLFIVQPGDLVSDSIILVPPLYRSVHVFFKNNFDTTNVYYLKLPGSITDCAGNGIDSLRPVRFAFPVKASSGDIVINEFLPDPLEDGARFIELYNRSDKMIDLMSLVISGEDSTAGLIPGARALVQAGCPIFPGDYYVITNDREDIMQRYRCPDQAAINDMTGFPGLGSDSGMILLARRDDMEIIDRFRYRGEMHYPLLITREGVSLERLRPDWPTDEVSNWHSAAETAGFATPGYLNSHHASEVAFSTGIELFPTIFSPDNDGYNDLINITVQDPNTGYAVSISIFDDQGRLVRRLASNVLAGQSSEFIWDGIGDDKKKVAMGLYIVQAELVWPDGRKQRVRKCFTAGGRF